MSAKDSNKKNEFRRQAQRAELVLLVLSETYMQSRASQQQVSPRFARPPGLIASQTRCALRPKQRMHSTHSLNVAVVSPRMFFKMKRCTSKKLIALPNVCIASLACLPACLGMGVVYEGRNCVLVQ